MASSEPEMMRVGSDGAPRYLAPPITEAVIELRFADRLNTSSFNRVISRLEKKYTSGKSEQMFEITVEFQTATPLLQNQRPLHRFSSADEADICIVKDDMISWSRLSPYEGWDALQSRVERDFDLVEKVARSRKVTRIGLRFINRIDVPFGEGDEICWYEDYLAVHLQLPPILDPTNSYGWRVERDFEEMGLKAVVQSGIMVPEIPETGAFSLDIDIGTMVDVPSGRADIFAKLQTMRKLKNDIFEQSITARARESFR